MKKEAEVLKKEAEVLKKGAEIAQKVAKTKGFKGFLARFARLLGDRGSR